MGRQIAPIAKQSRDLAMFGGDEQCDGTLLAGGSIPEASGDSVEGSRGLINAGTQHHNVSWRLTTSGFWSMVGLCSMSRATTFRVMDSRCVEPPGHQNTQVAK